MNKKVSTNINIDNELKTKCKKNKVNISQAAELGIKISLSGIDHQDLEKLIDQLSSNSYETVEANLELQKKIKSTNTLHKELRILIKEFEGLIEDWLNPIDNANFKDKVDECALRLNLKWMNLMNLIYQSQTNTHFNIKSVNYNEVKKMKFTEEDIEKISAKIHEQINKSFRHELKNRFNDILRTCLPYSFEEIINYNDDYQRLQNHARKLSLPAEKLYEITERYWKIDEIQDLTREECLNF